MFIGKQHKMCSLRVLTSPLALSNQVSAPYNTTQRGQGRTSTLIFTNIEKLPEVKKLSLPDSQGRTLVINFSSCLRPPWEMSGM